MIRYLDGINSFLSSEMSTVSKLKTIGDRLGFPGGV